MLERCVYLLQVVIAAGGHGHLEQPSSTVGWEEPVVRSFLHSQSCSCNFVSACGYGKNWHKNWMFASTFSELRSIAFKCPHAQGAHLSIQGLRAESGNFLSRETAEYPIALCERIAELVLPLVSQNSHNLMLDEAFMYAPKRHISLLHSAGKTGGFRFPRGSECTPYSERCFSRVASAVLSFDY